MKKIFCVMLAVLLLTGCSKNETPPVTTAPTTAPTQSTTPPPDEPDVPEPVTSAEIELLSCRFKDQVLPVDHEACFGYFPAEEGKIYIDLTLRVCNTGETPIGKEELSAFFEYEGMRYDMQLEVEENAWNFANEDRTVHPGQTRTVHLFYNADLAAVDSSITVHYNFLQESGEIAVGEQVQPVLEDKIQLQLADTVHWGNTGTIQIMDCLISTFLRATGKGAEKYYADTDSDLFILILKVDSETDPEPDLLDAYVMAGYEPEFVQILVESEDHLALTPLEEAAPPQPGQERILHLWLEIPFEIPTEDLAMRLNIETGSYYCRPIGQ